MNLKVVGAITRQISRRNGQNSLKSIQPIYKYNIKDIVKGDQVNIKIETYYQRIKGVMMA
jgi:hypothetical protein